jgi:hypothetical protein
MVGVPGGGGCARLAGVRSEYRLGINFCAHRLYAPVRVYDLGRLVGVDHYCAVLIQQSPALALFESVEKPNTGPGVCLPP